MFLKKIGVTKCYICFGVLIAYSWVNIFSKTLVVQLLLGGYTNGTLVYVLILVLVWRNQVEGYNLVLIFLWCPYYPIWWFNHALVGT